MKNRKGAVVAIVVILVHLAVSVVHGQAHSGAMVMLDRFGLWYVLIVITLAPLVAGALLWSRWRKFGALLLTASMFGSLVFGVWYHFVAAGADNVAEAHGPWRLTFAATALALAVLELIGFLTGLLIYLRGPRMDFISHNQLPNARR